MKFIEERVKKVDQDFLNYELENILDKDRELIIRIINKNIKINNPHNSILLYITGASDEFDFDKFHCDYVGGSPADIDTDLATSKRQEFKDLIVEKWGEKRVASLGTFGSAKIKASLRDFYRVTEPKPVGLYGKYTNWNEIHDHSTQLEDALQAVPNDNHGIPPDLDRIQEEADLLTKAPFDKWFNYAKYVEEPIKSTGTHAGGIIIADEPVYNRVPVCLNEFKYKDPSDYSSQSKPTWATQWDMKDTEDIGQLIKFDCLATLNLDIIAETVRLVKETRNIDINWKELPDHDPLAYRLLKSDFLAGIFQMETSDIMKQILHEFAPNSILETSNVTSMCRPGPLENGFNEIYMANKQRGFAPVDMPKCIADILADTYWTILYQEQIISIMTDVAGFSLVDADGVRRMMGKKKVKEVEKWQPKFVEACVSRGKLKEKQAINIWEQCAEFAAYGFNRAHAVSYSYITYACAYLKGNYYPEFMTALMSMRSIWGNDFHKHCPKYKQECNKLRLNLEQPSINESTNAFRLISDTRTIYYGFAGIKEVGAYKGLMIEKERKTNGIFKDIYDFIQRVDTTHINSSCISALVDAGAFDEFNLDRKSIKDSIAALLKWKQNVFKNIEKEKENRLRIIHNKKIAKAKDLKKKKEPYTQEELEILEYSKNQRRKVLLKLQDDSLPKIKTAYRIEDSELQADVLGMYLATHPAKKIFTNTIDISDLENVVNCSIAGTVREVRNIITKRGDKMSFVKISDGTGMIDVVIFPSTFRRLKDKPKEDDIICITGKNNPERSSFICDQLIIANTKENK